MRSRGGELSLLVWSDRHLTEPFDRAWSLQGPSRFAIGGRYECKQMSPVLAIGVWSVLFVGAHLFISSSLMRPRLVDRVGEQAFRGVYSLVAFATFIPLTIVFAHHKH